MVHLVDDVVFGNHGEGLVPRVAFTVSANLAKIADEDIITWRFDPPCVPNNLWDWLDRSSSGHEDPPQSASDEVEAPVSRR